jgi:hypothetical protein
MTENEHFSDNIVEVIPVQTFSTNPKYQGKMNISYIVKLSKI